MKILIINNGTKYLRNLLNLLPKAKFQIVNREKINLSANYQFDLAILTGGDQFSVIDHEKIYEQELNFIKKVSQPIIGICLGAQLIAYAFGGRLEYLKKRQKGIYQINSTKENPIFNNIKDYQVYENHLWVITKLPNSLISLAKSKEGIELFQHKDKMIYGLQFHPEIYPKKTSGAKIFFSIIRQIS